MRNSKSSLFLMEMIIAVLVFSISAAVCIQIFAKAYITSKKTQTLNNSVTLCSSAAELFYGFKGDMSKIQRELDPRHMSRVSNDALNFYYSDGFLPSYMGNAAYCLTMKNERSTDLLITHISMTDLESGETVYHLDCSLFLRGKDFAGDDELMFGDEELPEGVILPDAGSLEGEGGVL